jgi:hypothetical protein
MCYSVGAARCSWGSHPRFGVAQFDRPQNDAMGVLIVEARGPPADARRVAGKTYGLFFCLGGGNVTASQHSPLQTPQQQ